MRELLALAVQVPFVAMMWAGCNGDNGMGADAAPDMSVKDTAPDKKTPPDANMGEAAPVCAPAMTVDSSQITWTPPSTPNPGGCSDQQISDLYTDCYDPNNASTSKCQGWLGIAANTSCYTCLVSTEGKNTTFSALIDTGHGVIYANVGGCIALLQQDPSMTGCGAKYWEESECEDLACTANCPIVQNDNNVSFKAYQACTVQSQTSVCMPYVSAECNLSPDAGPDAAAVYDACFGPLNGGTFGTVMSAYGALFCGGYPADAGPPTDASADAPTDAPGDGG